MRAAGPGDVAGPPEEREVKLRVGADFVLPDLADDGATTIVDEGENLLVAVYWDTDGLDLAGAGVGLRHRNGTWTYKGRSRRDGDAVVREEREVEAADDAHLPDALLAMVGQSADPASVHPIATVRTRRRTLRLQRGDQSVEVVSDHVTVCDGDRPVATFSEVETEYSRDSQGLADRVVARLVEAGAVVDGTAKVVRALRALGHNPPEVWER